MRGGVIAMSSQQGYYSAPRKPKPNINDFDRNFHQEKVVASIEKQIERNVFMRDKFAVGSEKHDYYVEAIKSCQNVLELAKQGDEQTLSRFKFI